MNMETQKVAVIGAGIMGHGIALVCAQAGAKVSLIDSSAQALENGRVRIQESAELLRQNGLLEAAQADAALTNVIFSSRLEEASSADLVFEAIPERAELKQSLFQQLDRLCRPDTVFASNTSAIPITRLAEFSRNPQRVIGTHFFNPAQLIPLVEVITTEKTSPTVRDLVMELLSAAGKKPVHIAKDLPGFIANRLQLALAREAMSLVQKGIATPEAIDTVVKYSFALRMLFSGPLEQRDWNGLDTHIGAAQTIYPDLEDAREPLPILREKVAKGELGIKTGKGFYDWTSKDVAEVRKHKGQQLVNLLKFLQCNS
jgi:3-hydroxybutyryl-CoA dehydrogenase